MSTLEQLSDAAGQELEASSVCVPAGGRCGAAVWRKEGCLAGRCMFTAAQGLEIRVQRRGGQGGTANKIEMCRLIARQ